MCADDGFFRLFIEVDSANRTGWYAFTAAVAFFSVKEYAASRARLQGVGRTNLHTCSGFFASAAYDGNEATGHAAGRPDSDCALVDRVAVLIRDGADQCAGQASDAFVHTFWVKHKRHIVSSN